jgi:hypothetical protein
MIVALRPNSITAAVKLRPHFVSVLSNSHRLKIGSLAARLAGMPKVPVAVAVVAVLFSARLAAADDEIPESKDRTTAFTLSATGTAVSIGLVLAGVSTHNAALNATGILSSMITPAAGEIYAGRFFTTGMAIRLVSVGVGLVGVVEVASCTFPGVEAGGCSNGGGGGAALLVLGAVGYGAGIIYDIATAGREVDGYNQRLHLRITPSVIPTASSGPAMGIGITGSF